MKDKKIRLYSNIYLGISLAAMIILLFFDINSLFSIAYYPMSPDFIGGKILFAVFYIVAVIAVYISVFFKKRAPIFTILCLSAGFEIFNLFSPAISYGERYAYSLFSASGNLTATIKTVVIIGVLTLAALCFGIKSKAAKIVFRTFTIALPIAFIIFEFVTLSKLDASDIMNFTDKIEASLAFDLLRFTPAVMFSFIPEARL